MRYFFSIFQVLLCAGYGDLIAFDSFSQGKVRRLLLQFTLNLLLILEMANSALQVFLIP